MDFSRVLLALAAVALLATGCATKQQPATEAVAAVEASLAEVRDDAARYAPAGLQDAENSLLQLKQRLAQKDYKAVLVAASPLRQQVALLKETVVSQKTQIAAATHEWTYLSADVPKMLAAVQRRVDALSLAKKVPAGVKLEFETMKSMWADASAAFNAGKATEGADLARAVQSKGEAVMEQLGMSKVSS